MRQWLRWAVVLAVGTAGQAAAQRPQTEEPPAVVLDYYGDVPGKEVPYVPTPPLVVDAMLDTAGVHEGDVLYDLGCGDGRIVIAAAKRFGVRGVGIDIDPARIEEANANAKAAGVTKLVEFREQNLFDVDLSEATVVTLYLLPEVNRKLRPKLLRELHPGTRVVSHAFDMDDWMPDQELEVAGSTLYLWRIDAEDKAGAEVKGGAGGKAGGVR
jgi:SAM-dependent methyltransferase